LFDEEAVDVLRLFAKLKARLMPYLHNAALQASTEGIPMMRAMALEFPDDPACTHLERQYMLGDSLLVAPVFSQDGVVSYYVPEGVWTNYFTGEEIAGPRWVTTTCDFLSVPLLVRPNTVLPLGAVDDRPDYDYAEGVTLQMYRLSDGARVTTTVGGSVFHTRREGDSVHVDAESAPPSWQVAFNDGEEPIPANGSALTIGGVQ
jgi:alpha-D-xyloside xylohydrolase